MGKRMAVAVRSERWGTFLEITCELAGHGKDLNFALRWDAIRKLEQKGLMIRLILTLSLCLLCGGQTVVGEAGDLVGSCRTDGQTGRQDGSLD